MSQRPEYPGTTTLLILTGAAILIAHPVTWLATTWIDPSYDSAGGLIFLVLAGSFLWSATSARTGELSPKQSGERNLALALIFATSLFRWIGRVVAIDFISALALVIDVYAAGLYLGLGHRKRPLSPGWLALGFAFTLPLERVIQRTVGYALQQGAAAMSCGLLKTGFQDVTCEGVRILIAGKDVLVDLPCSGARGLLQILFLYVLMAALFRPRTGRAALGFGIALVSAYLANGLRIASLAIGVAFEDSIGIDVMVAPWHDVVGLAALALGCTPVLSWALWGSWHGTTREKERGSPKKSLSQLKVLKPRVWHGIAFVATSTVIISLPESPLDVQTGLKSPEAPLFLAGEQAEKLPLTETERRYFTQYGGGATKVRYGPSTLLMIRTSSPLRHLHAPDECLEGQGHLVERAGLEHGLLPSAVYRSVAPSGEVYRIAVTYLSGTGLMATTVAEVVWHWFQNPDDPWTALQRISLWDGDEDSVQRFDQALAQALDLGLEGDLEDLATFQAQFFLMDGGNDDDPPSDL